MKVGDIVEVRFMDHCEDSRELMPTIVWGKVSTRSRTTLVVCSWDADGDHNRKLWAIDRRTIDAIRVL